MSCPRLAELRWLHDHWAQVHIGAPEASAPGVRLRLVACQPLGQRPPPAGGLGDSEVVPAPRPFTLGGFRIAGRDYEIAAWLPGAEPLGARWWEDLSAWFLVRRVARPGR